MGANERLVASFPFAEIAADTDEAWYWTCPHDGDWLIEAVYFAPMTARTADASDYTTISCENAGTEIATGSTTSGSLGSLVAGTGVVIPITGTGKNLEITKGETLAFKKTDTGTTGLALDGQGTVALRRVRL